ncbi:MAG TPA: MBL fold metallo-hydrolase [Dehalococcoidia bacterium]|nr:MBL fold metallo-hydrolase [Dehalococcoidia bacterium]
MQVSPSVRAVQVPETNPMHPMFTTIYLVGRDQVLTIDTGDDADRYRWMLRGYLAAMEHAEVAQSAVTHYHTDHSANLRWLQDELGVEALVHRPTAPLLGARLPDHGVRLFDAGDELSPGSDVRVQTIATPGHSADSVCFYIEEEGVLFTGDTILGGSTTLVTDLAAYLDSLNTLRVLPNLRVICPGHGPLIDEPIAAIDSYIAHREERERQVLAALATGEAKTSWQIMEALYDNLDPRLRRMADANVRAHLEKLVKEGRVTLHPGTRREADAAEKAREDAEEAARQGVIKQADQYREEARRRALMRQESPPTELWSEPPRYELS